MPSREKKAGPPRELILDPAARIRQLSDHGSSVEVDSAIPIMRYYRSGSEMERQARVYYSEGQLERAFILYNKFATLFIEKIRKHPQYSKAAPTEKAKIKKLLKEVFPRAMELKDKLKAQFEEEKNELQTVIAEEERLRREEEAVKRAQEEELKRREQELREAREQEERQRREAEAVALATSTTLVDTQKDSTQPEPPSEDNQPSITYVETSFATQDSSFTEEIVPEEDSLVEDNIAPEPSSEEQTTNDESESLHLTATDPDLAHVLPNPVQRQGPTQAWDSGQSHDLGVIQALPTAAMEGLHHTPQSISPSAPPPPAYDQVYRDGHQMAPPSQIGTQPPLQSYMGAVDGAQSPMGVVSPRQSVALNPVLRQQSYDTMFQAPYQPPSVYPQQQVPPPCHTHMYYGAQPTYGYVPQGHAPYTHQYSDGYIQPPPPPRPVVSTSQSVDLHLDVEPMRPEVPTVDRSTKPASLKALSTSSNWEESEGYRTVVLPSDIASQFEQLASPNSRRDIETGGILGGKLSQNVFRVTHIIVPKQSGKSDSFESSNEEEIFEALDTYDLITLGWIHTHPSFTAFLSSVDLHIHCSYQVLLDEAIAIVVSPKYSEVGIFNLTEPHGLNYITHCEKEGFHEHPKNPPLFEECKHVQHDSNAFIQIVDLR